MGELAAFPAHTRYRGTDPDTSRAAAESLAEERVRASQGAVFALLKLCGPLTDTGVGYAYPALREHYAWPEQSPSGLRTRRCELVELGLVFDSGVRQVLPSGRHGIVWTTTPTGGSDA